MKLCPDCRFQKGGICFRNSVLGWELLEKEGKCPPPVYSPMTGEVTYRPGPFSGGYSAQWDSCNWRRLQGSCGPEAREFESRSHAAPSSE